jgi:hypothetical protein
MRGQWKIFLTGSAIGAVLGGYMMTRMRDNGRRVSLGPHDERVRRNVVSETVSGLASKAVEKMDDLSLRARTLNTRIGTRQ